MTALLAECALATALGIVIVLAVACWVRGHDGSMTGKAELTEDIAQDLMDEPKEES